MPLPAKNLLDDESSPYLRQHRDNPVHWRPWSEAALAEAREMGKPILLSVGYAACHWCHVMAHESFANDDIADLMNRLFVNIKVDREERPEIDQIYMAALNAMGEQGGWPLTMFLTPDGRPFWGGTYFPDKPRHGRPGFAQVLHSVADAFATKPDAITENANGLITHIAQRLASQAPPTDPAAKQLQSLADAVAGMIDPVAGGLQGAPKFPSAPFMEAMWINSLMRGDSLQREFFIHSLRNMLQGGIYDHIGGGLCRYATDSNWLVPHFEKMLYDNAALIRHASWAWAYSGDDMFRYRIEGVVEWLQREMVLPGGAFAASLDADSEGVEGKFYTWSRDEIEAVLGSDARPFIETYGVTKSGNWEGTNILHLRHQNGAGHESSPEFDVYRNRLLKARETRVRPARDDKIIVDWNAMMIRALCEAGRVFAEPQWFALAKNAYRFIKSRSSAERLPHTITGSHSRFPGLLGDHAAMMLAAITLFEVTSDRTYLKDARIWLDTLDQWHGDGSGGHYLTASDADDVPLRIRGDSDDAVTSATALSIEAVHRLALATGDATIQKRLDDLTANALGRAAALRFGQAGIITSAALTLQPLKLVIGLLDSDALVAAANRIPDPRRVDIRVHAGKPNGGSLLPDGTMITPNHAGAFICAGPVCYPPITDPEILSRRLSAPFR